MIFFEPEQVEKIHNHLIDRTGGMKGLRDKNLLDSALKTSFQTFGAKDLYPDIFVRRLQKMMYPFMTLDDNTEIVHSEMNADGKVRVMIETPDEKLGFKHESCILNGKMFPVTMKMN